MADILIRGIRLPQEDDPKVFLLKFREDNTAEMVAVGYPQKRYDVISVPPHGRLIDEDAINFDQFIMSGEDVVGVHTNYEAKNLIERTPTFVEASRATDG